MMIGYYGSEGEAWMATMHEIARKAGVSIATAYRVFNKSGVTSKK